jgi:hypothetical protein
MICLHFQKTLKGHQYGYQMKGRGLGSTNKLFIFRFLCLFTFCQQNSQWLRFKGYALLEVMQQREVATDLTFLNGYRFIVALKMWWALLGLTAL